MKMNGFCSFEMIACITFTTPALWAPFDSMCSINLEKFENSSHDGRNTIICGTFESLLFGDIVMIEFLAISRAAINSVFIVLIFYIQTDIQFIYGQTRKRVQFSLSYLNIFTAYK